MNKILLILGVVIIILAGCSPAATPQATAEAAPETPAVEIKATEVVPQAPETPQSAWQVVGTSNYRHSVYYAGFTDESMGITVGYAGEVRYTTDSGATWKVASNNSKCRFGLEIVDEQTAWHCGNGGHVRVSTDGGKSWKAVSNFGPNEPSQCRYLSFLDATTGWAATPGILAGTSDGGQTWQEIALPDGILSIIAIELISPQVGYVLGSSGSLYATTDGGATWTSQAPDFLKDAFVGKMASPLAAIRFTDGQHGMIVLSRGNADDGFYVWSAYTEDGGTTWREDQVTFERGLPFIYLSRDGSTVTVLNNVAKQMTILKFQPQ